MTNVVQLLVPLDINIEIGKNIFPVRSLNSPGFDVLQYLSYWVPTEEIFQQEIFHEIFQQI